jgi:hypothetical protein
MIIIDIQNRYAELNDVLSADAQVNAVAMQNALLIDASM